jgi:hypothetical protein
MTYEERLTGGHPNSLGNTIEVVADVLAHPERIEELYQCYFSEDEVVRLRVSNAMKRLARANGDLLFPYLDRFLKDISKIDQAFHPVDPGPTFSTLYERVYAPPASRGNGDPSGKS